MNSSWRDMKPGDVIVYDRHDHPWLETHRLIMTDGSFRYSKELKGYARMWCNEFDVPYLPYPGGLAARIPADDPAHAAQIKDRFGYIAYKITPQERVREVLRRLPEMSGLPVSHHYKIADAIVIAMHMK